MYILQFKDKHDKESYEKTVEKYYSLRKSMMAAYLDSVKEEQAFAREAANEKYRKYLQKIAIQTNKIMMSILTVEGIVCLPDKSEGLEFYGAMFPGSWVYDVRRISSECIDWMIKRGSIVKEDDKWYRPKIYGVLENLTKEEADKGLC